VKLGIIIYSNDPESVWNAFRLGNYAIKEGDEVKAFNVTEQIRSFVKGGGSILACGTCLKIRQSEGSETCPVSTLADLYTIVKESEKIITF
jgi:peroxiredoxin family protein